MMTAILSLFGAELISILPDLLSVIFNLFN